VDASQPRNLAPDLPERLKRKPRWLLNRLRCMTPLEVAHRLLRALQAHAGRSALLGGRDAPAPDLAAPFTAWIRPAAALDAPAYLAAADRIAEGCLDVFALRNVNLGQPPRWNRDPKTGIDAPLRYGKTLDYRDPDLVGDIKYLWEPNRHVHLVTLAQAWALSGDGKYLWTASADGTARLWDPVTGKERCRLYSFHAGKDWLVVTPDGHVDGSEGALGFVTYRVPGTLKLLDDDAIRRRFHRPGLRWCCPSRSDNH